MNRKVQVWIHTLGADGRPRVLLLKTNPARGSFWQPVTGGLEAGETLEIAALREATEETGLNFSGPPIPLGYEFTFPSRWAPNDVVEETAFTLQILSVAAVTLDPREHVEFQWLEPKQALSLLKFESNREALNRLAGYLG